jgi:hypothetical protein
VNGKGLRGPELDYPRPEGVLRVLYLGDSVTFGYCIADPLETYPYLAGPLLETSLGRPVETINAGIGGYSPWQEFLYLEREGIRYHPNLVLVGFVLNDLTEKIQLARFGGSGEGFQLEHTFKSRFDRWTDRVALLHFGTRLYARLRFGSDIQRKAAEIEWMNDKTLVDQPERPEYGRAWNDTLESLGSLFEFCKQRHLPAALVIFPYRFQYDDPEKYAGPQERLLRFASERGIPALDLMPGLIRRHESGRASEKRHLLGSQPFYRSGPRADRPAGGGLHPLESPSGHSLRPFDSGCHRRLTNHCAGGRIDSALVLEEIQSCLHRGNGGGSGASECFSPSRRCPRSASPPRILFI